MDKNVEIRSLASESFDVVAEAFMAAFADYNITFSKNQLADMMLRRGYRAELSFAAFSADGCPVSFILNGIGMWQGHLTAYDTGTGTVKEYRGLGLSERVFTHSIPLLRRAGVKRYLLEVLSDNTPAVKVYTRLGFHTVREFNCYSIPPRPHVATGNAEVDIQRVPLSEISPFREDFADFPPSWQNDFASFHRAADNMVAIVASVGNNPVGYAVAEPLYGDIAQIAVKPSMRRRGIATRLLSELMAVIGPRECRMVNVDTACRSLSDFLLASGFSLTVRQHEMMLPL